LEPNDRARCDEHHDAAVPDGAERTRGARSSITAARLLFARGSSDDTPARELLDRKGPTGATVGAHTPRIPKGRASTRFRPPALRFHAWVGDRKMKVALVSRQSQRLQGPREREIGRTTRGVTLSRHRFLRRVPGTPARRVERSLRGGAFPHGLGPRENTDALQGASGSPRENLFVDSFQETTRGVRGTRRRGLLRRESPRGAFASGPRPMSRAGQFPARSGTPRARSRKRSRESVIEAREWSFARATVERSTARRVVEGMAPHQGADHAKDDGIGSIR
jgi:hypothetical protein